MQEERGYDPTLEVQDLKHPQLGKLHCRLQILDIWMGFPHPTCKLVKDFFVYNYWPFAALSFHLDLLSAKLSVHGVLKSYFPEMKTVQLLKQ